MSQRKPIDFEKKLHFGSTKVGKHLLAIRIGNVFEREPVRGRQTFSACLMDEDYTFQHHSGLKFRAAKKLAKAWTK